MCDDPRINKRDYKKAFEKIQMLGLSFKVVHSDNYYKVYLIENGKVIGRSLKAKNNYTTKIAAYTKALHDLRFDYTTNDKFYNMFSKMSKNQKSLLSFAILQDPKMSVYMLIIFYGFSINNHTGFSTDKLFFDSLSSCKQAVMKIKNTDTGSVKKTVSKCIYVDGVVN